MRYSIFINQIKAVEWGLNLSDAAVFSFCYDLSAWADKVILGNEVYYFASRTKALEELPMVSDKPDTIYRIYKRLDDAGLIVWKKIDNKDCIQLTEKAKQWNTAQLGNKSEASEINPKPLGNKSEKEAKNHSEINPTYKITKTVVPGDKITSDKRGVFTPPALEELTDYMVERGLHQATAQRESETMHDHFESNGWKVGGKTKMKCWKAAARNWIRRRPEFNRTVQTSISTPAPQAQVFQIDAAQRQAAIEKVKTLGW